MGGRDGILVRGGGALSASEASAARKEWRRAEGALPIDLHYDKLADWLVDRKKVPKDWRKKVQAIQAKAKHILAGNSGGGSHATDNGEAAEVKRAAELLKEVRGALEESAVPDANYFLLRQLRDKMHEDAAASSAKDAGEGNPSTSSSSSLFGKVKLSLGVSRGGILPDLDQTIRVYEKSSLMLAEGSQVIQRLADYEIVALRGRIARAQQQATDAAKKEDEYARSAKTCAQNFQMACEAWGIAPHDVPGASSGISLAPGDASAATPPAMAPATPPQSLKSLEDLLQRRNLPQLFQIFAEATEMLMGDAFGEMLAYYEAFVSHVLAIAPAAMATEGDEDGALLPTLRALRRDAATREMAPLREIFTRVIHGDAGTAAMAAATGAEEKDGAHAREETEEDDDATQITWDLGGDGDAGNGNGNGNGADMGIDMDAPVEVSWDIDVAADGNAAVGGEEDAPALELNWDIDVTESTDAQDPCGIGSGIGIPSDEGSHCPGGMDVADGDLDISVASAKLCDHNWKSLLLDDLHELLAFFSERARASEGEGASLFFARPDRVHQNAPDADVLVHQSAPERMRAHAMAAERCVALVTSARVERLDRLRSRIARAKAAKHLHQMAGHEAKYLGMRDGVRERRRAIARELADDAPRLDAILQFTRQVKRGMEDILSQQYDNRPVNIIGEINNVLAN